MMAHSLVPELVKRLSDSRSHPSHPRREATWMLACTTLVSIRPRTCTASRCERRFLLSVAKCLRVKGM